MTEEKKQLREQRAFYSYTRPTALPTSYPIGRREPSNGGGGTSVSRGGTGTGMVPHSRRRVVTTPEHISEPLTWADRRARVKMHRRPARQQAHPLVKRTLARTGGLASSGQPLPRRSPIPRRSGKLKIGPKGLVWRVISFFVLLVIGVLGVNFALTSTNFKVQQVNIEGTHNPVLVKSIQHMGIQGQNIFLIDALALAAQVEMLPLVASATVGKQWPNSVTVTVVERIPVLLWQTRQATYSVDKQGVVMAPANETDGINHLKTVVDISKQVGQPIHPGTRLNAADVAFAVQVFARLPEVTGITSFTLHYDGTLYTRITGASGRLGFVVESSDGWVAYLGDAANANPLENRLIELQQILAITQDQQLHLATIDLRFGLRPVYTLKT